MDSPRQSKGLFNEFGRLSIKLKKLQGKPISRRIIRSNLGLKMVKIMKVYLIVFGLLTCTQLFAQWKVKDPGQDFQAAIQQAHSDESDEAMGIRRAPSSQAAAPAPSPAPSASAEESVATDASKKDPARKEYCSTLDDRAPFANKEGNGTTGYPGTEKFHTCDTMSKGFIRKLYTSNGSSGRGDFNWLPYLELACEKKCENLIEFNKCIESKKPLARECESVTYVMSFYDRDWNDDEQLQGTKSESNVRAPTGQTGGAQVAANYSSVKCKSVGIATLDYEACKKFNTQLELIEGVQQVGYGAQQLVYQGKMADSSIAHSTDPNTATGALKATAESLKMQQDMYQQRTAVDATKLAYLYSIYNDMPVVSDMKQKCNGISQKDIKGLGQVSVETCKAAINGTGTFGVAQNQEARDAMKSKLITIATSAGSNAILANLLGKRADDANNAIAKIEAFKPIDPFVVSEEEAVSTFCKVNPAMPQCLTGGLDQSTDIGSDNVINFGEGGSGTNYGGTNGITDSTNPFTPDATTPNSNVGSMGNVIASANKSNAIEGSKGATVTSAGVGGATGGGGGGGASAGSGNGGAPAAGGAAGGVAAAVAGKAPKYEGGAGSISVVGGFGINRAKGDGKGDENPFGKLFGKDGKPSGVVNFRDIASQKLGDKGDNIFNMISKRYTTVAADKRLLEYELTK